jgi:hypothetical protein
MLKSPLISLKKLETQKSYIMFGEALRRLVSKVTDYLPFFIRNCWIVKKRIMNTKCVPNEEKKMSALPVNHNGYGKGENKDS